MPPISSARIFCGCRPAGDADENRWLSCGKQQPVDIRLTAERLAGFPTALHQVEHPGGQAGLLP